METFTFGKYKGEKVSDIIQSNPDYVRWAHEQVSFFQLTDEQADQLSKAIDKRSYYPSRVYNSYLEYECSDEYDEEFDGPHSAGYIAMEDAFGSIY